MNVTLRQIQAFVLVAQTHSFTQAAQAMHVTQSALSLLVRELESVLDARLVNRTTRSISLTDVGMEFLPSAQHVLAELQHAIGNVDKLLAKERGRVVVAAPLVLSGTLLPDLFVGFQSRYPGIQMVLRDTLPDQVLPLVRTGAADLGIGTFHKTQNDLHRVLLFKESMVAVFARRHPLANSKRKRLRWSDLRGQPMLSLPRGSIFHDLAEHGFAAAGMAFEPVVEASYVGTLLGMVRAGLGVAIAPGHATTLGHRTSLAWKQLERPKVEREVTMVHRNTTSLSPAAQAFADYVCETVRK